MRITCHFFINKQLLGGNDSIFALVVMCILLGKTTKNETITKPIQSRKTTGLNGPELTLDLNFLYGNTLY